MSNSSYELQRLHTDDFSDANILGIGELIRVAVRQGAPLGWVDPPNHHELNALFRSIADEIATGDAAAVVVVHRAAEAVGTTAPAATTGASGTTAPSATTGASGTTAASTTTAPSPTTTPSATTAASEDTVGFAYWRRYVRPTHRPQADLPLLVVDRTARRHGLARLMLAELLDAARASGIEQVTLDARGDNQAAHRLWESSGFSRYGVLQDFVAVGAARYDKTFWVADLREPKS